MPVLRLGPGFQSGSGGAAGPPAWVLTSGANAAFMDIDFVNNRAWLSPSLTSISDLLACSRASSGYYTKADGTLQSFTSNALRYGSAGALIELTRTNLALRSQEFGTTWTPSGLTVTSDTQAAPDGTTTADTLTEDTATSAHIILQSVTGVASNLFGAVSCFVKAGTASFVFLTLRLASTNNFCAAVFNLATGAVTQTAVGSSSGQVASTEITALANGWYRISVVGRATGVSPEMIIGLAPAASGNSFSTDGSVSYLGASKTLHVWGAQVENPVSSGSSYIPTTTASATRATDLVTFSDLSWLDGAGDTLYVEWIAKNVNNATVLALDATNDKLLIETTGMKGSMAGATAGNNVAAGAVAKAAVRLKASDSAISVNGGAAVVNASATAPGTLTAARLGLDLAGANAIDGLIRRVSAFKGVAANDAALVALSA